jgi:DNA polymerase-1
LGVDGAVLLVIDGNSLVHRSYHAQARTGMHTADGQPAWAVRGLLTQLVAAVDRIRPAAVVVGFDDPDRSLRRERWPSYKAHRTEKLDTLVAQLAAAAEVLSDLGVAVVVPPGLEADDVLASCATHAQVCGAETVVMTSDRDAFALIDDTTRVLRIINGGVDASPLMTADRLVTLLGVRPDQYRDFAALRGDPSDNLPGVRGIGPRSAARLLAAFGTAAAAFDDLAAVRAQLGAGVADRLAHPDARANWELNCQVMTMHRDLEISLELSGGPGVLPFDAGRVAAAFRAQNLTWTISEAVRVLADVDTAAPPRQATTWTDPWADGRGRGPRRLPKLPPKKPAMAQLSLFD